jgi:hypothetical protein
MTERKFGGAGGRFATGKIVDIDDPLQMGRVRILRDGIDAGLTKDDIGWTIPHHGPENAALNQQGSGPHKLRVGTTVTVSHYDVDQQYPYISGTQHVGGSSDDQGQLQANSHIPQGAKEQQKMGPDGKSYDQPLNGDIFGNVPSEDGSNGNPGQPQGIGGMPLWKFGREMGPPNRNNKAKSSDLKDSIGYHQSANQVPLTQLNTYLANQGNKSGAITDSPLVMQRDKDGVSKMKKAILYHGLFRKKTGNPGDIPLPPPKPGMAQLNPGDQGGQDAMQDYMNPDGDQPYQDMQDNEPYDPGNGSEDPGAPDTSPDGGDSTPVADAGADAAAASEGFAVAEDSSAGVDAFAASDAANIGRASAMSFGYMGGGSDIV